jgi:hypothetical protein
VGVSHAKKTGRLRWPYLVPLGAGIFFNLLTVSCAPWQRVHPLDASLHEAIGYAPFWSRRFAGVAGASVDWQSVGVAIATTWVMCAVAAIVLSMSATRD